MTSRIDNYIEFKRNQKLLDRVYFMFAIEECLSHQNTNFEGFVIDRHKYELKDVITIRVKDEAFTLEIDNESLGLLSKEVKSSMKNLKTLIDIFSSDRKFVEHLNKSFQKTQATKYYLDAISLQEFKPQYLNGESYSLYEKIIIKSEMKLEEVVDNKKILKI
jgi:hypothetical protein